MPESFANTIINTADQAFVAGMNDAMLFGAAVMLINALLVILILPSRVRAPREEAPVQGAHERDLPGVAAAGD